MLPQKLISTLVAGALVGLAQALVEALGKRK